MTQHIAVAGMDFLHSHGAKRAQGSDAPDFRSASPVPTEGDADTENDEDATERGYEILPRRWQPINMPVQKSAPAKYVAWLPTRFIDGKDVGRAVAYLIAPQGFAVPLRLSQIGAIALRAEQDTDNVSASLGSETRTAEQVVSLMADLFTWDEIERFVAALAAQNIRLLVSRPLRGDEDPRNLSWMRENARNRTREEMFRHERDIFGGSDTSIATLMDGSLERKIDSRHAGLPLFGLVKTHANTRLLHAEGWQTLYDLRVGQRTPLIAYHSATLKMGMVTWYLRLRDGDGEPMGGVVRVEMMRHFYEEQTFCDANFINHFSGWLCRRVTCDSKYGRAAVTLEPIRRAEEVLGARFRSMEQLAEQFYRIAAL